MPKLNEKALKDRMKKAKIPGVSIAYLDSEGTISSTVLGKTDLSSSHPLTPVKADTIFGAASLSKPVFAYLVLKLIAAKKVPTPDGSAFDLNTPLSKIFPIEEFYKQVLKTTASKEFAEKAKGLTPKMILSHTTGIPIDGSPKFVFKSGTEFEYTGMGLIYLQKVIERQTGKSLETLVQEEVFKLLGMSHSSFLPPTKPQYMAHTQSSWAKVKEQPTLLLPPIAANSLHTTASDYARFVSAWMKDSDEIMKDAFTPVVSMTKDRWAKAMGVSEEDRQHLSWGLGLGLQQDDEGSVTTAFHSGDMDGWRGWVAMDLNTKSAVVYFANGRHHKEANGHVLADIIVAPVVKLAHGTSWFFKKFGFARDVEPGWKEKEKTNMARIQKYLSSRSSEPSSLEQSSGSSTTRMLRAMPPSFSPGPSPKPTAKKTNEVEKEPVSTVLDAIETESYKQPTRS